VNKQYTKRQHHFPQMMLKRFLNDTGKLYMYDNKSQEIKPQTTETVGYQNHLYSIFYNHTKDDILEKKFSRIEDDAEYLVNQALSLYWLPLSSGYFPEYLQDYSLNKLPRLIEFICILITRTPKRVGIVDMHGGSSKVIKTLIKKAKIGGYYDDTAKSYINKVQTVKGFSFVETVAQLVEDFQSKLLEGFDINLCFSSSGNFIVSDNYATIEHGPNFNFADAKSGQWWKADVTIFCPLSSRCCFAFTRRPSTANSPKFNIVNISSADIEKVNRITCNSKERYLYCASLDELRKFLPDAKIRHS
jgi:hypothetical protein